MSHRVDPNLLLGIKEYGDINVEACFNCGNCTAICPLSTEDASFPRRMIRYAQVGMRDRLLSSEHLWLCYYCGECSDTCPRQADPGEFMAAARRFAIASYDVTGLAKQMYKSTWFNVIVTIALAIFFGLFILSFRQEVPPGRLALWEWMPEVVVQIVGISIFAIAGLVGLLGMVKMVPSIYRARGLPPVGRTSVNWWQALRDTLAVDVLGHKSYRDEDCEEDSSTPWYVQKWFVHATIMYGFLGLLAATTLDFLFKPVGSQVPLYYPMRLLGTIAGLFFMYGVSVAILKRLWRRDQYTSDSQVSDWTFLALLWLTGLTGFLLEIAVYAPPPATWGYAMLIIHVAFAMDLLILLPFSKFAHVFYRTVAIFLHRIQPVEQGVEGSLAPAEA